MRNTIALDLDGTVYDLYSVPRWLHRITREDDVTAYTEGAALVDLDALASVASALIARGFRFVVVSYVAWGASEEYSAAIATAKSEWVEENLPFVEEVIIDRRTTPKRDLVEDALALIDDDAEILAEWTDALAIPAERMMAFLTDLLG